MRRLTGSPASLLGFGVALATGTLAWRSVRNTQIVILAHDEVTKLRKCLAVSPAVSEHITDDMLQQMLSGLQGDTKASTMLMLPSWLPSLPSGEEHGSVLAVDFGGTSFRVMQVILGKEIGDVKLMSSKEVEIPSAIYTGTVEQLYDFIAAHVVAFASSHGLLTSSSGSSGTAFDAPQNDTANSAAPPPKTAGLRTGGAGDATSATYAKALAGGSAAVEDRRADVDAEVRGTNGHEALLAAASAGEDYAACGSGRRGDSAGDEGRGTDDDGAGGWSDLRPASGAGSEAAHLPLGFCFSFPMEQRGLTSGRLIRWTKGFDISDGIGSDPAESLTQALRKRGWLGGVAALLNDGIGIFGAGRYQNPHTTISMILGTGTNAAYAEKIASVPSMHASGAPLAEYAETVVNTEWGAFSCPDIPRCSADLSLDEESVRPGTQLFEKLVSGLYLPEISRRAFLAIVKRTGVLNAATWGRLELPDALTAPQVAAIDDDDSVAQGGTAAVLMHALGMRRGHCTLLTCWTIKQVVDIVVGRAAQILAAGLTALLIKVGAPEKGGVFGIAVDGSVYHKYTKFRHRLHVAMAAAISRIGGAVDNSDAAWVAIAAHSPPNVKFRVQFVGCQGGSCFGAAVIAASQEQAT